MKKSALFLLLLLPGSSFAQATDRYLKAMQTNVAALDTTKQKKTFAALVNSFERIALAEKDKWLPYYYAGFCLLEVVSREKDFNEVDRQADRAEQMLAIADSLSRNNADIYALRSNLLYAKIVVDVLKRGPVLAPRAERLLHRAAELDPENPRVNLLIAQLKVFSPEGMGGDRKLGCRLVEKVLNAYQQLPPGDINPHWGKDAAENLARRCAKLTNQTP